MMNRKAIIVITVLIVLAFFVSAVVSLIASQVR